MKGWNCRNRTLTSWSRLPLACWHPNKFAPRWASSRKNNTTGLALPAEALTMKPPEPKPETSAIQAMESVLDAHPFLAGLKPEHLRTLKDNAMMMSYQPGEVIFREGDPANRFYLIQKGKVTLESSRRESEPVLIQTIGPGDVLGWSWLFPPYY